MAGTEVYRLLAAHIGRSVSRRIENWARETLNSGQCMYARYDLWELDQRNRISRFADGAMNVFGGK